ncbi:Aminodeoxychorismate lyase, partial [Linderina macrospora]
MLLDHSGSLEVQVTVEPQPTSSAQTPPPLLVLDSEPTADTHSVFVQCKTTHRQIYERAQSRIPKSLPSGTQVLLFNHDGLVTEGNIANVAVSVPVGGKLQLVTPKLDAGLLAGTVRSQLIETGKI